MTYTLHDELSRVLGSPVTSHKTYRGDGRSVRTPLVSSVPQYFVVGDESSDVPLSSDDVLTLEWSRSTTRCPVLFYTIRCNK